MFGSAALREREQDTNATPQRIWPHRLMSAVHPANTSLVNLLEKKQFLQADIGCFSPQELTTDI